MRRNSHDDVFDVEGHGPSTNRDPLAPVQTLDAFGMRGSHDGEVDDEENFDRMSSGMDEIDLAHIHQSLAYVTHYKRRNINEKLPPILMYEINDLGESQYLTMTLRELLNYVNQEAYELDEAYIRKMRELSLSQKLHHAASAGLGGKSNKGGSSGNLAGLDGSSCSSSSGSQHHHPHPHNTAAVMGSNRISPPPRMSTSTSNSNLVGILGAASTSHRDFTPSHHSAHPHTIPPPSSTAGIHNPATTSTTTSATSPHPAGHLDDKVYDSVRELRLRDLRRLDFQFNPNEEKLILIRRHVVLIAMDPIRAVIMARRLILIVPDGADTLLSILDQHMREWVNEEKAHRLEASSSHQQTQQPQSSDKSDPSHAEVDDLRSNASAANRQRYDHITPFEFNAYEALLTTVKALETQEFKKLQVSVNETLSYFKSGSLLLPVKVQEAMRASKNDLSAMMTRVSASRKALQELTEDDEEMALMNLTVLQEDPSLYRFPLIPEILGRHDEIEELTEGYLFDFNTLESKIALLKSNIQSAEELISLRLDTSRNDLLIATTALEVLACSIAFGAYITGAFGMNLDNTITLQGRQYSFMVVTVGSFVAMVIVFWIALSYLQRNGILPTRTALHKHGNVSSATPSDQATEQRFFAAKRTSIKQPRQTEIFSALTRRIRR